MIRLGTRGSDLALTQSGFVAKRLRAAGHPVELVTITTQGDTSDRPFREIEGKAFFTKELDEALLAHRIDLAVHSLKDLPTEDPPGLFTVTVLPRADPRDLLLLRRDIKVAPVTGMAGTHAPTAPPQLPAGLTLGTCSARRVAQIEHLFPHAKLRDLRGNVPTRIAKLRRGDYDGIVLAAAGIERLGLDLSDLQVVPLEPPWFLPAPGQGVLACRLRDEDATLPGLLLPLVDADAAEAARAERLVLAKLDGGCSLPLGAFARREGPSLALDVCLARDGRMQRVAVRAETPQEAAQAVLRRLLDIPTVLLTRPAGLDDELARALAQRGFGVLQQPGIRFVAIEPDAAQRAPLQQLANYDAVAFTSRHAVRAFARALAQQGLGWERVKRVAVVGHGTGVEAASCGVTPGILGPGTGGEGLARVLLHRLPRRARVLHPGALETEPAFAALLHEGGIEVTPLPLYTTQPILDDPPLPEERLVAVVASPSAARALLARPRVRVRLEQAPASLQLVAGGATTAAELSRLGHPPLAIARNPGIDEVIATLAHHLPHPQEKVA